MFSHAYKWLYVLLVKSDWPYQLCQHRFLTLFFITNVYYVKCGEIFRMLYGISFSHFSATSFECIISSKQSVYQKFIWSKIIFDKQNLKRKFNVWMFALWNPISFWGYLCPILLALKGSLTSHFVRFKACFLQKTRGSWESVFIFLKM